MSASFNFDKSKALLAAGAAASLGLLYYGYSKNKCCKRNSFQGEEHLTQEEADKRRHIIEGNISYEIHLNLEKGNHFSGKISMTFICQHIDDLTINYDGKEIKSIVVNGTELNGKSKNYKNLWSKTYVRIPKKHLKLKNLNTIVIHFANEYRRDGNGVHSFIDVDGNQYLYTMAEPYHMNKVMPIIDQPDIKGIMALTVEAPEDWTVISNEAPLEKETVKQRTKWLFSKTKLISTYLYSVSAGPWEKIEWKDTYKNIPMAIYSIKSLGQYLNNHSENMREVTNKCMKFYEEFYNYPYPFSKYDHIFIPEMNMGAMEHPGAVIFTDKALYKDEVKIERICIRHLIIAHEMAHMWFGNLVTMKWWNDLWLNESFADFAAYTCLHNIEFSFETVNFMELFFSDMQWGFEQDKKPTTHPIATSVINTLQAETNFDGITYSKGASTMKQLYFLMGKQAFCKAINQYFCKYAWNNATLNDFIDTLNIHFVSENNYDLYKWKDEWLCKAGINILTPEWFINADGDIEMVVHQKPYLDEYPTLRSHKICVAFIDDKNQIHRKDYFIRNSPKTILKYETNGQKIKAIFLNIDDYSFLQTNLDNESLVYFQENLGKLNDSFLRNMIWKSIHDMVVDGKLSSKKFINTVINNLPFEKSPGTLSDLCGNTRECLVTFIPKKFREQISNKLFSLLHDLLKDESLNVEVSKVLLETLIASARSKENLEIIQNIFKKNHGPLAHLKLTIYNEWFITKKIVRSEYISESVKKEILNEMSEKDKSDDGVKNLNELNVVLMSESERKEVWQRITSLTNDETLHSLLATVQGYNTEKYVDNEYITQYYRILPVIFKNKSWDYSRKFASSLQPHSSEEWVVIENEIEKLLDSLDKKEDLGLIRILKDQKDEQDKRMVAYELFLREESEQ